jgi:hypothetical protein
MAIVNVILTIEGHFGTSVADDDISAGKFETLGGLCAFEDEKLETDNGLSAWEPSGTARAVSVVAVCLSPVARCRAGTARAPDGQPASVLAPVSITRHLDRA